LLSVDTYSASLPGDVVMQKAQTTDYRIVWCGDADGSEKA